MFAFLQQFISKIAYQNAQKFNLGEQKYELLTEFFIQDTIFLSLPTNSLTYHSILAIL